MDEYAAPADSTGRPLCAPDRDMGRPASPSDMMLVLVGMSPLAHAVPNADFRPAAASATACLALSMTPDIVKNSCVTPS